MPEDMKNPEPGNPDKERPVIPVLRVNPSAEGSGPAAYLHWKGKVYGYEKPVDFRLLLGNDQRGYLDDNFRVMFVGQVRDWPFPGVDRQDIARDFQNGLESWVVITVSGARARVRLDHAEPMLFRAELLPEHSQPGVKITPVAFLDRSVLDEERAKARQVYERSKQHG